MQIGKIRLIGTLIVAVLLNSAVVAKDTLKQKHLDDLNCVANEVAKFDGTQWVCGKDIDTSAATECAAGEVLLGDGSCAILIPAGQACASGFVVTGFGDDGKIICSTPEVPPESCEDGKPTTLVFEYTGENCDASDNAQGDSAACFGDPAGAEIVQVVMTQDDLEITVTPGDESLGVGDRVTIDKSDGSNFASQIKFDIRQSNATLQSLTVHTSCSAPLDVGDQYGSMILREYIPETP